MRINVYEEKDDEAAGDYDEYVRPPRRVGWFDSEKAERWDDMDPVDNSGSDGVGRGQALNRTAQGKWVLEHWSIWQGERSTYVYIEPDEAREWLLRHNEDAAAGRFFGELPEEEDQRLGRPPIGGGATSFIPGTELLAKVGEYAQRNRMTRAEALRTLIALGLDTEGPRRRGDVIIMPQDEDYEGERAVLIRHIITDGPSRWIARVMKPGTDTDGQEVEMGDGFAEAAELVYG